MAFKRSVEDLRFIEQQMMNPEFSNGKRLTVQFLTDPAMYRELLPPLLTPLAEPLAVVGIGSWESNCVGPYTGGSLSLLAEHEGIVGGVAVGMWMDSEPAINFGRDVLGEPKKFAQASITRTENQVEAWIERHGVRIIEIKADLSEPLEPEQQQRFSFNYRSRQSVDGFSLEQPAVLTRSTFDTTVHERYLANAAAKFRSTVHDSVEDLPILEIRSAEYQLHDIVGKTEAVGEVPQEEFLSFHYGRFDDFTQL